MEKKNSSARRELLEAPNLDLKINTQQPHNFKLLLYQLPSKLTDQELAFILSLQKSNRIEELAPISFPKDHLRLPVGSRVVNVEKELFEILIKKKEIEIRGKKVKILAFEGDQTVVQVLDLYKDRVLCVKGVHKYNPIDETLEFVKREIVNGFDDVFFPQDKNNKNRDFFYVILKDNLALNRTLEGVLPFLDYKNQAVSVQKYKMPSKFKAIYDKFKKNNYPKKKAEIVKNLFRGPNNHPIRALGHPEIPLTVAKGKKMVPSDLQNLQFLKKKIDRGNNLGHIEVLQNVLTNIEMINNGPRKAKSKNTKTYYRMNKISNQNGDSSNLGQINFKPEYRHSGARDKPLE